MGVGVPPPNFYKFMTAKEAKIISENSKSSVYKLELEKIYTLIGEIANKGGVTANYDLRTNIPITLIKGLIQKLNDDGYTVERSHGYDQRDEVSWDYLIIQW